MNYFEKRFNTNSVDTDEVKYDFWRYGDKTGKKLDDFEVKYISSIINGAINKNQKIKKIRILDVGCGTGYHLINLFKNFENEKDLQIIGIDRNQNYINQFKSNIKNDPAVYEKRNMFNVENMSAKDLSLLENKIDNPEKNSDTINIVIILGVLQYLSFDEIRSLSSGIINIMPSKTLVVIKHPLTYGKEIVKEILREGQVYNSEYKNFENVYLPFSYEFDFVKMEKCYYKKSLSKKELDLISPKDDNFLTYVVLESRDMNNENLCTYL